jgi:hypothetical protein
MGWDMNRTRSMKCQKVDKIQDQQMVKIEDGLVVNRKLSFTMRRRMMGNHLTGIFNAVNELQVNFVMKRLVIG